MPRGREALIGAVAAALLAAAPAAAAPINLGPGRAPSIAIDQAGTAFVAWDAESALGFCRLPRR